MSKANEPTLQELTIQFEELVSWFEQDEFDVEAAIEKYEQAHKLAQQIKTKLDTIENKITVLKTSFGD